MKHTLPVTIIFLALFIVAQLIGLILVKSQISDIQETAEGIEITLDETVLIDRPEVSGVDSVVYIVIGVAIGTLILLWLAKKKQVNIWRIWFMVAVWLAVTLALGAILPGSPVYIPLILSALLTLWKVYYPNIYIQNITEILMYSGLAVLLVPILNVTYALIILILFSAYDAYAVWKSKHMIAMAEFASGSKLFPGFSLPYTAGKKTKLHQTYKEMETPPKAPKSKRKTGVLGGGDVVFPLLFAGAVMLDLIGRGLTKQVAFNYTMIVVLGSAAALFYLFVVAKKNKFYPAMPFLTVGCLVGWGLMWLVLFIV